MDIPEAITILQRAVDNKPVIPHSELHIAERLGIEALKLIEQHPTIRFFLEDKLLPGETEE